MQPFRRQLIEIATWPTFAPIVGVHWNPCKKCNYASILELLHLRLPIYVWTTLPLEVVDQQISIIGKFLFYFMFSILQMGKGAKLEVFSSMEVILISHSVFQVSTEHSKNAIFDGALNNKVEFTRHVKTILSLVKH